MDTPELSTPNIYNSLENKGARSNPDVQDRLINEGVCAKKLMFCSWDAWRTWENTSVQGRKRIKTET